MLALVQALGQARASAPQYKIAIVPRSWDTKLKTKWRAGQE